MKVSSNIIAHWLSIREGREFGGHDGRKPLKSWYVMRRDGRWGGETSSHFSIWAKSATNLTASESMGNELDRGGVLRTGVHS